MSEENTTPEEFEFKPGDLVEDVVTGEAFSLADFSTAPQNKYPLFGNFTRYTTCGRVHKKINTLLFA